MLNFLRNKVLQLPGVGVGVGGGIMSQQGRLWYSEGELAVQLRHPWYYF